MMRVPFLTFLLSLFVPAVVLAEEHFPAEIEAAAFEKSSGTNRALERMGYFTYPSVMRNRSLRTSLIGKIFNSLPLPRSSTQILRNFHQDVVSDQWIKIPEGKKIRIYLPTKGQPVPTLWQFPEGTKFIHRTWRLINGKPEPFEFRVLKKLKIAWLFGTYILDGGKLKLLVDPSQSIIELPDPISKVPIRMTRVSYESCVRCHNNAGAKEMIPRELFNNGYHSRLELAPCEFLPNNPLLENFLLERFKTHLSFFECDPGVKHVLCTGAAK